MSDWQVYYTDEAQNDLSDVYDYIAFTLLAADTAKNQLERIMGAIDELGHLPFRHELYDDDPWRSRGLLQMPVDHYLVFYLPIEAHHLVAIVRIMYGGSDTKSRLLNTPTV